MIIADDIVFRLLRSHPIWSKEPDFFLYGEEKNFGTLKIVFNENDYIEWAIWIDDREAILVSVKDALENFKNHCKIYND